MGNTGMSEKAEETMLMVIGLSLVFVVGLTIFLKITVKESANDIVSGRITKGFEYSMYACLGLPFLVAYRHRDFLLVLYGIGVFAIASLFLHCVINRKKDGFSMLGGFQWPLFVLLLVGFSILAFSWYWTLTELYLDVCKWIEKVILKR